MISPGSARWIPGSRREQGHGYGTAARAAVLELAFGPLGAEEAGPEYLEGNHASERVSRKLGYVGNGQHLVHRDDTATTTETGSAWGASVGEEPGRRVVCGDRHRAMPGYVRRRGQHEQEVC
jgi:Acetyltransferase (GNAT) domain